KFLKSDKPVPFFLSLLLGQAALLVAVLLLPKYSPGFFPLTVGVVLATIAWSARRAKLSSPSKIIVRITKELAHPIPAAGWVALVIGTVFFARDFGPAGHDTLHHLYWARQ